MILCVQSDQLVIVLGAITRPSQAMERGDNNYPPPEAQAGGPWAVERSDSPPNTLTGGSKVLLRDDLRPLRTLEKPPIKVRAKDQVERQPSPLSRCGKESLKGTNWVVLRHKHPPQAMERDHVSCLPKVWTGLYWKQPSPTGCGEGPCEQQRSSKSTMSPRGCKPE